MAHRICNRCGQLRRPRGRGLCWPCFSFMEAAGQLPGKLHRSFDEWWASVDKSAGESECWMWPGPVSSSGYAVSRGTKGTMGAYAVVWEKTHGPVPTGMTIDHTCHNSSLDCSAESCLHRRCVNPAHLAIKTPGDNVRASPNAWFWQKSSWTHCEKGHEFTPENTCRSKNGRRECRTCRNKRKRDAYRRQVTKQA